MRSLPDDVVYGVIMPLLKVRERVRLSAALRRRPKDRAANVDQDPKYVTLYRYSKRMVSSAGLAKSAEISQDVLACLRMHRRHPSTPGICRRLGVDVGLIADDPAAGSVPSSASVIAAIRERRAIDADDLSSIDSWTSTQVSQVLDAIVMCASPSVYDAIVPRMQAALLRHCPDKFCKMLFWCALLFGNVDLFVHLTSLRSEHHAERRDFLIDHMWQVTCGSYASARAATAYVDFVNANCACDSERRRALERAVGGDPAHLPIGSRGVVETFNVIMDALDGLAS